MAPDSAILYPARRAFATLVRRDQEALIRIAIVLFLILLLPGTSRADTATHTPAPTKSANDTRIEADERAGVIRFIVDGEERVVLDADGLHVNGSIDYTGSLTDTNVWPGSEAKDAQ